MKGPIVMSGYWKRQDLTEEVIKDGWLHTGDIASTDHEGFVYIMDRRKDMYISGGENVYPAEIEKVLLAHPKVADAAVVGVEDGKWGEVGKAFVVLKENQETPWKSSLCSWRTSWQGTRYRSTSSLSMRSRRQPPRR